MNQPDDAHIDSDDAGHNRTPLGGWIKTAFPVIPQLRAYTLKKFRADLIAGLTVSLVSIPQAIGFALIAGLPPEMVILSIVVGGFVCGFFSDSRHMVFGPTNSISILLAATIYAFGETGLTPPEITILLACLIGIFQLAAGLARFGRATQFISRSVIIAYSTAIGLLIACGQIPNLLGLETTGGLNLFGTIKLLVDTALHIHPTWTSPLPFLIGAGTLILFALFDKFLPKFPGVLTTLAATALLTWLLNLDHHGVRTIADEGALAAAVPSFIGLPLGQSNIALIPSLLQVSLAIAILGMLEGVLISKTLAAKSGQAHDSNRELVAMGFANIANSLFGAMPGSASFARSAANYQSGARTQLATILSSLIVLGLVFAFLPFINYIPIPAIAAHLIRIGLRMINPAEIRVSTRATKSDAIVFATTFLAALTLRLDSAIYVGVGVSLALFLRKAATPSLTEYDFNDQGQLTELRNANRNNPAISIVHVEGELFFGAADILQDQVRRLAEDPAIKIVILRIKQARHLDATTVMVLNQLNEFLTKNNRHLLISGCRPDAYKILRRSGALKKIGSENIFPAEANLTMSTKRALQRAQQLLIADGLDPSHPDLRIFAPAAANPEETPA